MSGFSIKSDFFCIFKTGDNINYNLKILRYFYSLFNNDKEGRELLLKPIVVLLATITEAMLYDFYKRIYTNTQEGIVNISNTVLWHIRNKKIDEFSKYISNAKKHNFFDSDDKSFYDELEKLRKMRNRIHIQNAKFFKPKDEGSVFTEEAKEVAEKCVEKVAKILSKKYSRPSCTTGYVTEMNFPWEEHFK